MNKSKILGGFAIAIAAIMWGFDGVVLTPRLYNLDVRFVVFILHCIPFILMNIFLYKEYKRMKSFAKSDIILLVLISMAGGVIGTLSIVKALFLVNFNHLSVVVLLQKLQPVFAILLSAILLHEKISRRFIIWAIPAIIAGYTLVFGFNFPYSQEGDRNLLAAMFALLAAFGFGSSTVLSKMALAKYSFKTVTFYRYGLTSLIMLVLVSVNGLFVQFHLTSKLNWVLFVIIGLTTGSGAILLYYYGLTRVRAIISAVVELMFPVSTIVFDFLINKSVLSPVQWVSAGVMVFSMLKINDWNEKNGKAF